MASYLNSHSPPTNTSLLNIWKQWRMTVPLSGVPNQTAWHCALLEGSIPSENLLRIDSQNEQRGESCVHVLPPSTSWSKRKALEDRVWAAGREGNEYISSRGSTNIQLLEASVPSYMKTQSPHCCSFSQAFQRNKHEFHILLSQEQWTSVNNISKAFLGLSDPFPICPRWIL